ncbi:hypothetical protein ACHHYP_01503 [Achlya hypogyna]|uniref:Transmembrane protein 19 n=1 Tax=Achlya hypogyna TaxID=1202772 RepID=A0A1V9ZTC2_ACHHY|nr:hypothetical protein ACHHYP_01503 [Achlya hypogyna]
MARDRHSIALNVLFGVICHCGYRFGILLVGYYISGAVLSAFQETRKASLDVNINGGRCSARQVLTRTFLACIVCVAYAVFFKADAPLDASAEPVATFLWGCFIGHYACCAADTWASELGVLSPTPPVLITNWCTRVPPGTNGGISLVGTLASAAGGAFIGLLFYVYGVCFLPVATVPQWPVIVFGLVAGLIGSLVDSLLGATVQATWYSEPAKSVIPVPAVPKSCVHRHVCGHDLLTNEQVNLVSVTFTTVVCGYLIQVFF